MQPPLARGRLDAAVARRAAALALAALALLVLARKFGLAGLALPIVALTTVILLQRPGWCLAAMAGAPILAEREPGSLTAGAWLYQERIAGVSLLYGLVGLFLASVGLAALRRRGGPGLRPAIVAGCALALMALIAGIVTGHDAGTRATLLWDGALPLVALVALPFAVHATLYSDARLRTALLVGLCLTVLKAVLGLVSIATGAGSPQALGGENVGTRLTYYEPVANWLCLLVLLAGIAALQRRVRLPAWAWAAMPLVTASLLLSYRRSFWLATILGLVVVLALGTSKIQFRLAVPTLACVALLTWATLSLGNLQEPLGGAVTERAQSLSPTKVAANAQDRYRLDERANALEEIRDHPVTGLGIGVPWRARHPLALEHGRQYVHFALLWFWLKFGLLGAMAYVIIMAGGVLAGLRAARHRQDPVLRCVGAAAAGAFLGLALAETTATFLGDDPRMTVVVAVALGVVSSLATIRATPERPPPVTASTA